MPIPCHGVARWRWLSWGSPALAGWLVAGFSLMSMAAGAAEPVTSTQTPPKGAGEASELSFYTFYEQRYQQARQRAGQLTNDFTAAWQWAQACFDLGEFATNDTQRAAVAEEGILASRRAIALKENHAAGHYYLGMNLGQLARTKQLAALRLVKEMQDAFYRARDLDAQFDFAGADRCLGLLYRDAPGWPISVGNRTLARQHLAQALQLAPLYPENPLNWAETLWQWRQTQEARKQLAVVQKAMEHARTNLTGVFWAASWRDWTNRWNTLTNRLLRVEK
ncbi:hypothetical protein NXS98_10530 [Fontisphaera persica]|uniref:hypothetical protein n=1 Tax=Fontisphaera persica TaxID=2974023 RepID=UPI0024BF5CA2|nr:hypothetical protein [Fontisphaera persica]WCJ58160.1 hypothetical protein NXS98_10530 [Fontisphaera persica]